MTMGADEQLRQDLTAQLDWLASSVGKRNYMGMGSTTISIRTFYAAMKALKVIVLEAGLPIPQLNPLFTGEIQAIWGDVYVAYGPERATIMVVDPDTGEASEKTVDSKDTGSVIRSVKEAERASA